MSGETYDPRILGTGSRWLVAGLGLLSVAVGAYLTLNPFASLAILVVLVVAALALIGLAELLASRTSDQAWHDRLEAFGWLGAALVVAVWPQITLRALAIIVGVALIVSGLVRCISGLRGTSDGRFASIIGGTASIVLGVVALAWPDITVFVIGVVVGIRLLYVGILSLIAALRGRKPQRSAASTSGWRRWSRSLAATAALAVALGLLALSSTLNAAQPKPDAFYTAPAEVPDEPGQLLRSEPFSKAVPEGAEAWRILYTTTRDEDDTPALASAIVLRANQAPSGPTPVIAWAHGTTGVTPGCAPSVLDDPFEAGAMPALDRVIDEGWVLVATDYVGLGTEGPHPYLVGQGEGRSVLDAVRAARQLDDVEIANDQTVVWGHSQGGHAALWTGILAPEYAPEVGVIGVAAMAPASNLPGLIENLNELPGGSIFASYVVEGFTSSYDDVNASDYIRPTAQVVVEEMATRCLAEPSALVSVLESFAVPTPIWDQDPTSGPFGQRLDENVPDGPIDAPLLLAQGESDPLVLPQAQAEYVANRCASGQAVDYRTYPGEDHLSVVADDSPLIDELIAWTNERIENEPALDTCA